MSGRDPINPLFIGYFRQKFPLQLIIAEGTGNGGMPRQIFIYKVTDNAFTEEFPASARASSRYSVFPPTS